MWSVVPHSPRDDTLKCGICFSIFFIGTHFQIFVRTFLVHLHTVYASPASYFYIILPLLARIQRAILRMLLNVPFHCFHQRQSIFLSGLHTQINFAFQVTSKLCGTPLILLQHSQPSKDLWGGGGGIELLNCPDLHSRSCLWLNFMALKPTLFSQPCTPKHNDSQTSLTLTQTSIAGLAFGSTLWP